jgi:hypothetical protein
MALLTDRHGSGAHSQFARLERGGVKYPSFNLILDYLRACRAGSKDIADLMDGYVSQPSVLKQKGDAAVAELMKSLPKSERRLMLKWEKASAEKRERMTVEEPKKRRRVETAQQRVYRVVWSFIHANWNEVFEQRLYEALLRLRDEVPRSRRKDACGHARRAFGVLTRHHKSAARRQGALERIERRAEADGFCGRVVAVLVAAAAGAYSELATSGRLGWEPTEEEIVRTRGNAPKVLRAETRMEMDAAGPQADFSRALALVHAAVFMAMEDRLSAARLDHYSVKRFYYGWLGRLLEVAVKYGTDSAEWRADIDASAPKMHDEAFARETMAVVARTFDRWKVTLQPRPAAAT